MVRHQPGSLRLAFLLISLISLLLIPFQASAAPKGTNLERSITALGPKVTEGGLAAFRVKFQNGTSNISKFQFIGQYTNASYVGSSPNICQANSNDDGLTCGNGGLAGGATFEVVVVLRADGNGGVKLSGDFFGDSRKSAGAKQDTWLVDPDTVTLGTSDDIYASWQQGLEAEFGLPRSSQQVFVEVTRGAGGYFTMIQQSGDDLTCTDPLTNLQRTITGYGKAIDLNVASGDDSTIVMTIHFAPQAGLNATTVKIMHERDGQCYELPRNCLLNAGDCFDAWIEGTGAARHVVAYVEVPRNGRFRGF